MNILLPITELTLNITHGVKDVVTELGLTAESLISVEYAVDPGQPEILHKDPDDSQPGYEASMQIYRTTTAAKTVFADDCGASLSLPAGTDITLLMRARFTELENAIWAELDEVEA